LNSILIIWTMVFATAVPGSYTREFDWRQLAAFENAAACHKAAQELRIPKERYRCIDRWKGEAQ
jgi:hypothetical protein